MTPVKSFQLHGKLLSFCYRYYGGYFLNVVNDEASAGMNVRGEGDARYCMWHIISLVEVNSYISRSVGQEMVRTGTPAQRAEHIIM